MLDLTLRWSAAPPEYVIRGHVGENQDFAQYDSRKPGVKGATPMPIRTFASKDGTAIGCFESGSGPPLVLLHGMAADHGRWAPVLPELERHYTVYACDRRGRGASGAGEPYAIEREFEDVAAVVDGIGGPVDVAMDTAPDLFTREVLAFLTAPVPSEHS